MSESIIADIRARIEQECQALFHFQRFTHITQNAYINARCAALYGAFAHLEQEIGTGPAMEFLQQTYHRTLAPEDFSTTITHPTVFVPVEETPLLCDGAPAPAAHGNCL